MSALKSVRKSGSRTILDNTKESNPETVLSVEDGKKIEATDDTFKEASKLGTVAKTDSVTHFDDLRVTAK